MILKTIVEIIQTRRKSCVKDPIDRVRNLNFSAVILSVFLINGVAIMTTIAETVLTK